MTGSSVYPVPDSIRSRFVPAVNGLTVHCLEAGPADPDAPAVLLLHGFPELAYSWRKVMPPLAEAGYRVIAPDFRGFGRTTGWSATWSSAADLRPFRLLTAVRDQLGLLQALGVRSVAAVVGHDFGAWVAPWCALVRPDVFRSLVVLSSPFAGPPSLATAGTDPRADWPARLAGLPRPRKHYQWYYSTPAANDDMVRAPQGVHDFLRAYFHMKSADWAGNRPHPLADASAEQLAELPTYYVMDIGATMPETVAPEMPSAAEIATNTWLPDDELAVYAAEYRRVGFGGGLQWYRRATTGLDQAELELFSGRTVDVPTLYLAGASDWGTHQVPGALETMRTTACTNLVGTHLIDGAGHWAQQEQPETVTRHLLDFLADGDLNREPSAPG